MDVKEVSSLGSAAWARVFRRARRAVLARRRLLAALCAAAAVLAGLHQVQARQARVPVLVAAHDLAAGVRLHASDLRRVPMEPGLVPSGVLAEATGRVVAAPARAGEPITDARVVGAGLVPTDGEVVVPVRLSDPAVVAQLSVGQVVDLLAVGATGSAEELAGAARVVALPRAGGGGDLAGRLVLFSIPEGERDTVIAAAVRDYITVGFSGSLGN